jgi:uracil phosphoribosyltransferase
MENVKIMDHPLIKHKISLLRDSSTSSKEFRELVSEIAMLMCYEATRDLPLKEIEIETPMGTARSEILNNVKVAFVPILRAGLGMVDGMIELIPAAKVGHIGMYRDPETLNPEQYYCKLPSDIARRDVYVLDPMLATGGSASGAVDILKKAGVKNIKLLCLIACPEGIENFTKAHPDVQLFCGTVDKGLNDEGFIVPGLGDCGDRIFGTK